MHIPKLFWVFCLAALGATSIHAQTMPEVTTDRKLTPEQEAKMRADLRQAIEQSRAAATNAPEATVKAAPAKAPAATATPVPAATPTAAVTPTPQPAPAPTPTAAAVTPAPAAGSKEARLLELEALYKGGQITASDYQTRRALIRAEK